MKKTLRNEIISFLGESRKNIQILGTVPMTINNIFSVLSSSEPVLELKVIKTVTEPPVQALKATVTIKDGYALQINESLG
ncbi:MAG: hypothetical protein ACM3RX_06650 [Methanococcaceae archaeon]